MQQTSAPAMSRNNLLVMSTGRVAGVAAEQVNLPSRQRTAARPFRQKGHGWSVTKKGRQPWGYTWTTRKGLSAE